MSFRSSALGFLAVLTLAPSMFAATFVVPADRELVRRAHGIVIATALPSYARAGSDTAVETVTPMQIEETIKGRFDSTIDVVEPGGTFGGTSMVIAGVPQFETGQRMLLFLASTGKDRWAVTDLVLGKFTFSSADNGEQLLVRDEDEIVGWDPNLKPHVEGRRSADRFLQFVRAEAAGGMAQANYFTTATPAISPATTSTAIRPALMTTYSATSYTMVVSGSMGSRWTVFPSAVNWYTGTTTEPGAPNGGITAAQTGIASWDNDCPSNVNYVYAGVDNGTHTQGLHAADGANTILFERDLSTWGVSPFSCSSSGYSGTLGIGGVTSASGTNSLNGETFATTQEGDVEMNRGIANCTLLFGNGDFNSAVTHELGHTLGFRHSDQTRSGSAACSTDPTLECSSSAIMTAFVTRNLNGALTSWDQHAVDALYPGGSCTTCTPPSITSQPQSTTTSGGSVTLSVGASGTAPFSYQWYIGTSGTTSNPISGATGPSVTVSPSSTTSYWVRVSNSCGAANSGTATVTVNSGGGGGGGLSATVESWRSDFDGDGRADILWRNTSTGAVNIWFMNGLTVTSRGTADFVDSSWSIQGVGDLNGDGRADIIWRNSSTGAVNVWLMNGLTVLSRTRIDVVDSTWSIAAIADFNHDGRADLLWRNSVTGSINVWLMNGTSILARGPIGTVDASWQIAGTGDFDGNGTSDILWRSTSGADSIWFMNGMTVSSQMPLETVPTTWIISAVGDLNGDGRADIIWRNTSTFQVNAWLMSGASVLSRGTIDFVDFSWTLVGSEDFNNDGRWDLLWRNNSSGSVNIWLQSGLSIASRGVVEVVPFVWQIQAPQR